jgi:amino acid adenylation domain-containing protein
LIEKTFIESFEEKVVLYPSSIAFIYEESFFTYDKLNRLANRLAHCLRRLGVSEDVVVAIDVGRCEELLIAILAVIKSGGAYLLLDAALPLIRTEEILRDSNAKIIITKGLYCKNILADTIVVDLGAQSMANEDEGNLSLKVGGNALLYVVYTSGSTGLPKGVEIMRKSVDNLLRGVQENLHITFIDNWLAITALSFDIFNLEFLLPLSEGATVVLLSDDKRQDPVFLAKVCREGGITFMQSTPLLWEMVADQIKEKLPHLTILCGGDILLQPLVKKLWEINSNVWNLYGPTETTIWSFMKKIRDPLEEVTIGRPVGNTIFYILDKNCMPVAKGAVGELYIGGDGVARGYRNKELLSREAFFPALFGSILYKTGDFVSLLENGEVRYVGRAASMVKIRGYRVELQEVENRIQKCSGITRGIVLVQDGFLIAYLAGCYQEDRVKEELSTYLPFYMLPTIYVHLDKLPLTLSGKVDRRVLQFSVVGGVIEIFAKLLPVKTIGIDDNFFSLGGNSLLAARAIIEVNKVFSLSLPLNTLFQKTTPRSLAQEIGRGYRDLQEGKLLSDEEEYFWFLAQKSATTAAYSIPFVIDFKGSLHERLLEKTLIVIVERHLCLRSIFQERRGKLERFYGETLPFGLEVKEISIVKEAISFIEEEAKKPFVDFTAPLFRFILIKISESRYWLFSNFHHMIFDGESVNIFIKEIKAFYENQFLPLLPKRLYQKRRLEKNQAWWTKELEGAPLSLQLPFDRAKVKVSSHAGAALKFLIVKAKEWEALVESQNSTLFLFLLTVFHVFLYQYTGQKDCVVATAVGARGSQEDLLHIGCFVEVFPLRVFLNPTDCFFNFLEKIRNKFFEARAHGNVFLKDLNISIQAMFSMTPRQDVSRIGDLEIDVYDVDRKSCHVDLSLSARENQEGIIGVFEYNTDLFDERTIKRMADQFQFLVQTIVANPHQTLEQIASLVQKKVKKRIKKWNLPSVEYSIDKCFIQEFEERVEMLPDATALICGGKKLSYQELNEKANAVAHCLISMQIQAEAPVCICIERSSEYIVAILGVLKAKGAFVPLDYQGGTRRFQDVLEELNPFCVIANDRLVEKFGGFKTISIDKIYNFSKKNLCLARQKGELAYIIYTSGSTGTPKGVAIENGALADRIFWKKKAHPLSPLDTVLHVYSFVFDGSILNCFWPLCSGACLVISTHEELSYPKALLEVINRYRITTVDLLASLLQEILREKDFILCTFLREVFSGGEALPMKTVRTFYKKCRATLYNTYGPTEATVEASVWKCSTRSKGVFAPIGKCIGGARLYVLNRDSSCALVGVVGELYIGGVGLARGYYNDHFLTQERFIEHREFSRLYRTGDFVKYRKDGNIEFVGRIDDEVKIRGVRIHLLEIENVLTQERSVSRARVLAKGEGIYCHIVAYIQPSSFFHLEKLKSILKHQLPSYMFPQEFVVLENFPLLPSGKIDSHRLLTIKSSCVETSPSITTPLEKKLMSIWKKLLPFSVFGVDDNFFEIGGNSLLAARLMVAIQNQIDRDFSLSLLFQYPTIRKLADKFQRQEAKKAPLLILIKKGSGLKSFFCVHPIGGQVFCYIHFMKYLTPFVSFYSIRASGLEGQEPLFSSIEEMAQAYIRLIKEVQPSGPYILGGWSFGGVVAAQMAYELLKMGDTAQLVLIDTTAHIEQFQRMDVDDESKLLAQLLEHYKKPYKNFSKREFAAFIENGGRGPCKKNRREIDTLIAVAKNNYTALKKFSIPYLNISAILLRSKENSDVSESLGWDKYIEQIKVLPMPGDHFAITEKRYASDYGKILSHFLDNGP